MANTVLIEKDGKTIEVTEKAFRVVYKAQGFKLAEGKEEQNEKIEDVDFYTLSREQLEKIKNDDLKNFLTTEEIDFEVKATKDELIDLILGE